MLLLKNLLRRLWTRFDIWVGFVQPKLNSNPPHPNDFYWLFLFMYWILEVVGIVFNIKFLIIYAGLAILLIIFCILYQSNLTYKFKFLDNLFSQLSMSLKLTNPFIFFFPVEYSMMVRFLSSIILIKYFTGNVSLGKFFISLFSSSLSVLYNYLPSWNIKDCIRINVNDSWLRKIMNSTPPGSTTGATAPETSNKSPVPDEVPGSFLNTLQVTPQSAIPIMQPRMESHLHEFPVWGNSNIPLDVSSPIVVANVNTLYLQILQQTPDYIFEVARRALRKMGDPSLSELPGKASNYHQLFSYEEYVAVKFFMRNSWSAKYAERGGPKYGIWQSVLPAGPDDTLKVHGPLSYQSTFYKEFKNNLIAYKQEHGL